MLQPVSGSIFTLIQWEDEENQRGTPMLNRAAALLLSNYPLYPTRQISGHLRLSLSHLHEWKRLDTIAFAVFMKPVYTLMFSKKATFLKKPVLNRFYDAYHKLQRHISELYIIMKLGEIAILLQDFSPKIISLK